MSAASSSQGQVPSKEQVLEALRNIKAPEQNINIVDQGIVSEIFIADGKVMFSLAVPANDAKSFEPFRAKIEDFVSQMNGVKSAMVALTADKKSGSAVPTSNPQSKFGSKSGAVKSKTNIPGVKSIIAVASGKGGVGKSTTSVNLALAMVANGLRVGILDADIYGPSMPRLLGITDKPETIGDGKILRPLEAFGVKVMSIGFLVAEDSAMIWRGPMVISALTQMLRQVAWGELDALIVDMPPGTGDAQLTMAQQVPLAGTVIVSTPQDLALIDARKGINMFNRVEVPILGIVENMSFFVCPKCGEQHDIFGNGGAEKEAIKIGVPFLGAVPLHMDIRETSDAGTPIVIKEPDGEHAKIYREIAKQVWQKSEEVSGSLEGPSIVFE